MNVLLDTVGTPPKLVWDAVRADRVPTSLMLEMPLALCALPDLSLPMACPMRRHSQLASAQVKPR